MTSTRKSALWIGGIALVIVAVAAVYLGGAPRSGENAAGTVAAAQRYRAEQPTAQDVKLGNPANVASANAVVPASDTAAAAAERNAQTGLLQAGMGKSEAAGNSAQNLAQKKIETNLSANQNADRVARKIEADRNASLNADKMARKNAADLNANADRIARKNAADLNANLNAQNAAERKLETNRAANLNAQNAAERKLETNRAVNQNAQNAANRKLEADRNADRNVQNAADLLRR